MNEFAPIVLFVYNRPRHTKQVLDALSCADCVKESDLYIYADGSKNNPSSDEIIKVREIVTDSIYKESFRSVNIILRENNYGLENNILDGVSRIISEYGRVIVLEDDIVVSKDYVRFMNDALDMFKDDKKIWSISTNTPYSRELNKSRYDILWSYRAGCWGWATWADRWNMVDWSVSDYKEFIHDKRKQRLFNKGGRDLSWMLGLQQKGFIQSWAIRWCYSQFKSGMITLFPRNAKSINIGTDGSGVNSGVRREKNRPLDINSDNRIKWQYSLDDHTLQDVFSKRFRYIYWRQRLGALWYVITDYDNTMIRR